MAARRLLIIMLLLLGVSSVIAIALPDPNRDDSTSEQKAATGSTGETGATGESGTSGATGEGDSDPVGASAGPGREVAGETIDLDARKPERIRAKAGSRMILTVKSKSGSEVEIEGLGLTGFADPYAPAVFDVILPPEPGRYQVSAPEARPSAVIDTRP